jgi:2-aminoadipate transaminase
MPSGAGPGAPGFDPSMLSRRAAAVSAGIQWTRGYRPTEPVPGKGEAPVEPIMLTGGLPDDDALPADLLLEAAEAVLRREKRFALQYGGTHGAPSLREWLAAEHARLDGVPLGPENVSLTNGAAGALANACDAFVDPGDVVLVEAPTFPIFVRAARAAGAEIAGVPLDADGVVPDELDRLLIETRAAGKRAKLLYTIPNFQNPTGATMTLERRRAVVDLCRRHGVLVLEDDAYGEIRFEGERLPSLFALAGGEGAIYVGTFSKTIAPGLRAGWALASKEITDALVSTRFDMGASPFIQRVIAELCVSGRLAQHVPRVVALYRRKRDAMLSLLDERCARYARWNIPAGGFFLWLELAEGVDADGLAAAAAEEGIAYANGAAFFADGAAEGQRFIRLAYSQVPERDIPEAIMRLGRAMERVARR